MSSESGPKNTFPSLKQDSAASSRGKSGAEKLREIDSHSFISESQIAGQPVFIIKPERLRDVVKLMRSALDFDMLLDVIAVDYLGKKSPRFEVSYPFYNTKGRERLWLRVLVPDDKEPVLDSITDIYPSANWAEREVFDLFGIEFRGHPNLKRILMWDNFEGHPLRKDYPLQKRQPLPTMKDLI